METKKNLKKTKKTIDPLDAALEYAIDKEIDSVNAEDMIFKNVLREVLKVKPLWGDD